MTATASRSGGSSVAVIAQVFGLTPRRIQQLVAEGILPRGERGRYDLAACVRAYITYLQAQLDEARKIAGRPQGSAVLEEEKALRARVDRELAEIRLEQARKSLVPAETVERDLDRMLGGLRARIVAIAARWADRMVGHQKARDAAPHLDDLTRELLAALRRGHEAAPEEDAAE